jgi:hypothetical protein
VVAELAAQQWLPHGVVRGSPHEPRHPAAGRLVLEHTGGGQDAQERNARSQAQPVGNRERVEAEHRHRGVERVDVVADVDRRLRSVPLQPGAETDVLDQLHRGTVRLEEMVVELFQPHAGLDLETRGQAAGHRLALEDGHIVASVGQAHGHGQPERARTDHPVAQTSPLPRDSARV